MKKKTRIILLIITILLVSNVITLNARVNDKKEQKNQPNNEKDASSSKNNKGLAKGKSKQDTILIPPEPLDPVSPPESLPEVKLNVYKNIECTIAADNIWWGEIEVGGSQQVSLYLKNNGGIEVIASLVTENWYPENAIDSFELVWDYNGQFISPGEVLEVTLTLSVSDVCSLLDAFSFDIVIIGS